jgi:hypothetical protein
MPLTYLVLLAITLISGWIYLSTSEDISFVLALMTGLTCFFWGFACAHWLVQLIIVGLLWNLYRVYMPDQQKV